MRALNPGGALNSIRRKFQHLTKLGTQVVEPAREYDKPWARTHAGQEFENDKRPNHKVGTLVRPGYGSVKLQQSYVLSGAL